MCFDDASEAAACQEFAQYDWATVTRLPEDPDLNKYMEGAAYLRTLRDNRSKWQDADLVGTLSYNAASKIDVSLLRMMCKEKQGADVVALLPSTEPLLLNSLQGHPRFLEVWVPLLLHLGYAASDVVHSHMPAFFCNYWLATPAWMDKFLVFYSSVRDALEDLPNIQEALWSDSGYRRTLSAEKCEQLYGRPYFPYHPFVCERLACFFFWSEKATVALAPLGKQKFWQEYFDYQMVRVCISARTMNELMPLR